MDALPDLLSGKIVIEEGLSSALLLSGRGDGEQSDLLEDHDDVLILKQNRNLGRNQLRLSARRDVHGIAGGQTSPRVFLELPVYANAIRLEHLSHLPTLGSSKHLLQVFQKLSLRADGSAHRRRFYRHAAAKTEALTAIARLRDCAISTLRRSKSRNGRVG